MARTAAALATRRVFCLMPGLTREPECPPYRGATVPSTVGRRSRHLSRRTTLGGRSSRSVIAHTSGDRHRHQRRLSHLCGTEGWMYVCHEEALPSSAACSSLLLLCSRTIAEPLAWKRCRRRQEKQAAPSGRSSRCLSALSVTDRGNGGRRGHHVAARVSAASARPRPFAKCAMRRSTSDTQPRLRGRHRSQNYCRWRISAP